MADATTIESFFASLTRLDSGCWQHVNKPMPSGYVQVSMNGKTYLAHRLAYFLAVGDIPDGHVVRHMCNNPSCCNPAHLETGTQADNNADTRAAGRNKFGSAHHNAKLTEVQVVEILLAHHRDGESIASLARRFDFDYSAMWEIVSGRRWKHVYAQLCAIWKP